MSHNHADAVRLFWALFLQVKVSSDGSVPGFNRWWSEAHPELRAIGQRMAVDAGHRCDAGAPPDQVVIPAVAAFRRSVQAFRPRREADSPPAWSQFCGEVFAQVMDHHWKPAQVLAALYGAEERFVALECPIREWIAELEAMGSEWSSESQGGADGR